MPEIPKGTCFQDALLQFLDGNTVSDGVLVHGDVDGGSGERIGHAWVENDDFVWDPQLGLLSRAAYYDRFRPTPEVRYTRSTAERAWFRAGHYGPWLPSERPT